ncbi:dTDP-glucose 4,6-dehydratase [Aurantiacibacter aquimixticola]|uniref:dTDP-glucose 4,6-dehydratase n=1 Tax=Aurantiacibacter aquimixticola TaxID=1958945 RepID=A0A419RUI2_9SPHN|nr:dTDP-glucose 4,6-dehydratase [Aurantiacibacter aquimixticola]RJY09453.1 dTDP-glucose 4,6-dehydratase [Aurantiacibacter aquimixticola]
MANMLVTGGAGFIGGNFIRYWSDHHPDDWVVVLDALTYAGNEATIADVENVELVIGDIRDADLVTQLLRDRSVDTLVNFAAESHVDRSIGGPDAFIDTNIVGTHALLKAARAVWLDSGSNTSHRFHHISTDEVYGSLMPDEEPFSENTQYRPNSPYSASKAASDHLVRAYHHTYGLQATTSNCSNNYGPYQYPEKLIPLFILNALHGRPLPIYGDGTNVRDWLHVEDHCRGIEACLLRGRAGETYNIGGGVELANIEVVDRVCTEVDRAFSEIGNLDERFPDAPAASGHKSCDLKIFVEDRLGHDKRYAIDDTKARNELGLVPQRDFSDGLRTMVRWYVDNPKWWQPLWADRDTGTA